MIRKNRDGEKMVIGFIGAGKVCHALSLYFGKVHSVGVFSKTFAHAANLAERTRGKVYSDISRLVEESDLIFISTPDGQIVPVAELVTSSGVDVKGKAFGHFSGSLSSEILSSLQRKGAVTFSLHPAQSFSNPDLAVLQLPKTVFTAEGTDRYEKWVSKLFEAFPNEILHIGSANKVTYHAAMVFLSNYLTTLYGLSEELLTSIGLSKRESSALLLPLLDSTVSNLHEKGFRALTGPLERGDASTVRNHLSALEGHFSLVSLYRLLGQETLRLMKRENRRVLDWKEIEEGEKREGSE